MLVIRTNQLKSSIFPFVLNGNKGFLDHTYEHQSIYVSKGNLLMQMSEFDITPQNLGKMGAVSKPVNIKLFFLIACGLNLFIGALSGWNSNWFHTIPPIFCCLALGWAYVRIEQSMREKSCLEISSIVTCSIVGDYHPSPFGDCNKNPRDKVNENTIELMKTGKISGWTYVNMTTGKLLWISNNDLKKIVLELNDDQKTTDNSY